MKANHALCIKNRMQTWGQIMRHESYKHGYMSDIQNENDKKDFKKRKIYLRLLFLSR